MRAPSSNRSQRFPNAGTMPLSGLLLYWLGPDYSMHTQLLTELKARNATASFKDSLAVSRYTICDARFVDQTAGVLTMGPGHLLGVAVTRICYSSNATADLAISHHFAIVVLLVAVDVVAWSCGSADEAIV